MITYLVTGLREPERKSGVRLFGWPMPYLAEFQATNDQDAKRKFKTDFADIPQRRLYKAID